MRIWIFVWIFCCSLAFAQNPATYQNRLRERVKVSLERAEDFRTLMLRDFQIDYCSKRQQGELYLYVTPYEKEQLKQMGFTPASHPVKIGKDSRNVSYHTYETLTQELQRLSQRYPELTQLVSLGQTVEGREIWCIKISDNAQREEAEPDFKYVSSMHGDEVVGKEMMVYLIRLLLEQYNQDERITYLVNHTQIYIIPSMNPDGTARHRRYNANWVDLNRDFPDIVDDKDNNSKGRAIETQHLMEFSKQHNFVLSINFHGGALVVNYPWDTTGDKPPYIQLIRELSLGYSERNAPMYQSPHFPQGIVNGYDWYEIDGGMQDWNYHWHNTIELTLELSDEKWPNASELPKFWENNRESLLWYLSQVHQGIHGVITDKATGKPIAATVKVEGIAKDVTSKSTTGDYYRVLLPGTYHLTFEAPGYQSVTVTGVEVNTNPLQPTILNIALPQLSPLK